MTDQLAPVEKIAPASPEAEEALLGSILINESVFWLVSTIVRASDFFIVKNGWVWEALRTLANRGDHIDNLTTVDELRSAGRLDNIGGSSYITWLINNTPTHIHAETYARMVQRSAMRRRLLAAAGDIAQIALEENAEIDQVIDQVESTLFIATERSDQRDLKPVAASASDFYDRVEAIARSGEPAGLPTGFADLDRIIGGLQKSAVHILAARPGMGKTSFALNITRNVSRIPGLRVAFFSLEMDEDQLISKLAAAEAGINSKKFKSGDLTADEWTRFTEAIARLSGRGLFIDDTPAISVNQIRSKCRRMKIEMGLDLIVIDYLQLMGSERDHDKRNTEVMYISRGLKTLARELRVPILCLAQLNRNLETRADKRPILSDLAESGAIEADADVVLFIYREDYYDENSERQNQADIIAAKNREGDTGAATLWFLRQHSEFQNFSKSAVNLAKF